MRVTSFTSGFLPQTHTGNSGGQVQPRAPAHLALDDAVLERMEGDDGQSAAGIEAADRSLHHVADGAELIVHGDADGLKASLCGVLLFAQRLRGHGRADDVHQLQRRFDGAFSRARQMAAAICGA